MTAATSGHGDGAGPVVWRDPIDLDALAPTLGLGSHEHVAVVGGGGKTTTMYALIDQLSGSRVATTTTKMGHDQHRGLPVLVSPTDDELVVAAERGPVVAWRATEKTKAIGVSPATCDRWFALVDHVVIEADGSRHRPFKTPGALEPVVPTTATVVAVVMGAEALGRVIGDQCHRPLRVAALAGCRPYERLTPERAAAVLLHERGYRSAVPAGARLVVLVTKVDHATAPAVNELLDALDEGLRPIGGRSTSDDGADAVTVSSVVLVARSSSPLSTTG